MQTIVGWMDGVVVANQTGGIILDPSKKENHGNSYTFISHAHSDHIRGLDSNRKGYLTCGTKDILVSGNCNKSLENYISLKYGDTVTFDGLEVSVYNSGHILGSAQYVIRNDISTIVYTGDLNCREMLTTSAADIIPCDILILETTYGNPFYVFPSLTSIYIEIINWAISEVQKERTPTFIVYSVGKAQELIKIFNELTSIPVVVSQSIARINEAYKKNGIKLKYFNSISDEGNELLKQQCVQVISPSEKMLASNHSSFATATGWALKSKNNGNTSFPLSGHADFDQLMNYVKLAKPKEVLTIHGFKDYFSRYISNKLGIRSRAIPIIEQNNLKMFL